MRDAFSNTRNICGPHKHTNPAWARFNGKGERTNSIISSVKIERILAPKLMTDIA